MTNVDGAADGPRYTAVRRTLTQLRNPTLAGRGMITRRVELAAPPERVYATLLDAGALATITGLAARLNPVMGGDISLLDGYLSGVVSELLENRHLVFAVRPEEDGWPKTHMASATFMLKPATDGCLLTFFQQDVPSEYYDLMQDLWEKHFWSSLPKAFDPE